MSGSTKNSKLKTQNYIDVSAALIFRDGKLLVARRHPDVHLGGLWEFPGGKRDPHETFEQCLVREIREELGVEISVGRLFEEIVHTYPEKTVHLKFYICAVITGEPQPLGSAAVQWVERDALDTYEFPAADAQLLVKLKAMEFKL
ncbi:MAG TPA: 8-oxo-dGTP diphosphatase MutT [Desulfuromonadaceae bacterium]|nr:8-oxo-dGTP diphosphatase MutT [Desulfuromonadaceae bacterium]